MSVFEAARGRPTDNGSRARARTAAPLLAVALAACGTSGTGPEPGDPITQLPRSLTAAEVELIHRSNAFGFALASRVTAGDERPNIVLSPLSASMALGMTLNGAAGTTFDAMRGALAFEGLTQEEINASYRGLLELLTTLDPAVELSIANAIWANQDVPFHEAFFTAVREAFGAAVESSDFSHPATLGAINGWVDDQTRGHIDRILDELDPDLVMLLLNAIWFDGRWTTRFDPADTRPGDFHRPDGSMVTVDFMNIEGLEFPLAGGPDWSAAELPYGGGAWSLVVVVPYGQRSARRLFAELDPEAWQEIVSELRPARVDRLSIPKLTLRYDVYLNDPLGAMGMQEAFLPGADFTRLSPVGDRLCIDFVRQKTFIDVDEAGTRAAAVTAVGIGPTSFTGLIADRPFVFALRERLSGTVLFMGLVEDPTAETPDPEEPARYCHG